MRYQIERHHTGKWFFPRQISTRARRHGGLCAALGLMLFGASATVSAQDSYKTWEDRKSVV